MSYYLCMNNDMAAILPITYYENDIKYDLIDKEGS